jgi:hypothetical protein
LFPFTWCVRQPAPSANDCITSGNILHDYRFAIKMNASPHATCASSYVSDSNKTRYPKTPSASTESAHGISTLPVQTRRVAGMLALF